VPSETQILDTISNKPFALLSDVDCETLKKWLLTAKFIPDITIINKLDGLKTSGFNDGKLGKQIASIQKIDDAFSSIVNMDYFPVTISQLPVVNGQRLGPGQFLNYIRTHLNNFTQDDLFSPYNGFGIDDNATWNSTSPKGAIIGIDLSGPDNASVITSYSSTDRWTFTTIFEPKYGEHPVSGNRNFGYTLNDNGSYTFYTRGVDRMTSWDIAFAQAALNIPFSSADNLWETFQNKITAFVQSHSGSASVAQKEIFRPDWEKVKKVLQGKLPLSTLSKNCPD
jgi:hypothetical protein